MTTTFSPFVYWAQSETNLFIKIDLRDVKDPDVSLEERRLYFKCTGLGARGLQNYEFLLDFSDEVNVDKSTFKVLDSKVDFSIVKAKPSWWSRLTSQPAKPAWLKIDFERWRSEDPDDDSDRDIAKDYPGLYEELQKQELGYSKEEWRKVYLTIYNLFMFVGFLYVSIVLIVRFLRSGLDSVPGTYAAVGSPMVFLTMLQFLEIMHPLFGYVKSSALTAFMQIGGRGLILFLLLDPEPRMQTKPVVFYLFLVWSAVEIIRYPYYISQQFNRENGLLTWLRYTVWVVLYPIGFVCEGTIMLRSIPYLEETGRWSLALPNEYNFAFNFPMVLRAHMLILMLPGMYTLMAYMYRMRCKKLGPNKWKKSKKIN